MKVTDFLKKQVKEAMPDEKRIEKIREETDNLIGNLNRAIKKNRIRAEIFLGGSFAKGTLIRKEKYDIDIFVRFSGYDEKKISGMLGNLLKGMGAEKVHGSRDYYRIQKEDMFEIIPVMKIARPEEAKNVTDLSYFHVSYILKEIKKKNIAGDIVLAKSFCYGNKCYGAESYIHGFSGYALELLVSYYGSFIGFIREVSKAKKQLIIDPSKHYKNRDDILTGLNEAKLQSPIVFVDPTYKERNALAALSAETFLRFQKACKEFLKKPGKSYFEIKKVNEKKFNSILEAETDKQEGDIAGSKLLKFYRFLNSHVEKYFFVKNREFEYSEKKKARYYFNIKPRKEIILSGPPVNMPERLMGFKAAHKNVFIKGGKSFAREKVNMDFRKFIEKIKKDYKKSIEEMGIVGLKII